MENIMKSPCDGCQGKLYEEDACTLTCKEYKEYQEFWERYFDNKDDKKVKNE